MQDTECENECWLEQIDLILLFKELSPTTIAVCGFLQLWSLEFKAVVSLDLDVIVISCTCTTSQPWGQKYASNPSFNAFRYFVQHFRQPQFRGVPQS